MCAAARVADVGESAAMESEPKKKLDDLIHLAELCIDVLQQNEEFHAEVGASVTAARCRAPPPSRGPAARSFAGGSVFTATMRSQFAPPLFCLRLMRSCKLL